jgi:hypothetical protein
MKEKNTGFVKGIGNFLSLLKDNKILNNTKNIEEPNEHNTVNYSKNEDQNYPNVKKYLENVHETHSFVLKNGEKITNLTELFYKLQKLDEDTFSHHVNDEKHDFADWVHHCIEDKELAQSLKEIKDKDDLTIAVGERVRDHLTNINIR